MVLTPSKKEDGYWRVAVWVDGKRLWKPVHRLVCLAFHGEAPAENSMACHKDGNKDRNRASNLYWGTARTNYEDAVRHKTARRMPLTVTLRSDEVDALREWINRDRVLNRKALSAYERGRFGGKRTPSQRRAMRKRAKSMGYTPEMKVSDFP